jgi:hypothetical protein
MDLQASPDGMTEVGRTLTQFAPAYGAVNQLITDISAGLVEGLGDDPTSTAVKTQLTQLGRLTAALRDTQDGLYRTGQAMVTSADQYRLTEETNTRTIGTTPPSTQPPSTHPPSAHPTAPGAEP